MPAPSTPSRTETHTAGDYVTWALVALLCALGPVLAHGARDNEMYVFGFSLFGFCAAFLFAEIKRHYDELDAAPLAVASGHSHA